MPRPRIRPGDTMRLCYPVRNRAGVPLEYRWRTIRVQEVRSIFGRPLRPETLLMSPLVRRGWTYITAIDLELNETRHFYLEAAKGYQLPDFQLGFFDGRKHRKICFGQHFEPTRDGYLALQDAIDQCLESIGEQLSDGVIFTAFPVRPSCNRSAS